MSELKQYRGRHTEFVTVYIPIGYDIIKIIQHLAQEQGTASNIKDKTTRLNVQDALERMIRHLRLYPRTPPNGLAAFSGNIASQEGIQESSITIGEEFVRVVSSVRKEKASKGKSLKEPIKLLVCDVDLSKVETDLKAVTQAQKVEYKTELKVEL